MKTRHCTYFSAWMAVKSPIYQNILALGGKQVVRHSKPNTLGACSTHYQAAGEPSPRSKVQGEGAYREHTHAQPSQ